MHDTGIIFEPEKNIEIDGKCYFEPGIIVHTKGGGLGQVLRWREIALDTFRSSKSILSRLK